MNLMREEMRQMRESLNGLLAERRPPHSLESALTAQNLPLGTPSNTQTSPAGLSSTREDNTQMAMTRENSLEPEHKPDHAVTVEEPMSSLYEVTRLRNIRSNKAKTVRPMPGSQGELNDFISRGVISEHEAEELYKM